jgi:hypothetical protein
MCDDDIPTLILARWGEFDVLRAQVEEKRGNQFFELPVVDASEKGRIARKCAQESA